MSSESRSQVQEQESPSPAGKQQTVHSGRSRSNVLLLSLLVYALLITGLLVRNGAILTLTLPFIFFLIAAYIYAPQKPLLEIHRQVSDETVSQGRPVTISVTLTNKGESIDEILIEDQVPANLEILNGSPLALTPLREDETIRIEYSVRGNRGSYPIEVTHVQVSDHLGLVSRQVTLRQITYLNVKPEVWQLRSIPIRPLRTHLYTGPIPSHRGGSGLNFFELRAYEIGDPLRRINWKAASKHEDELFTNQFEVERITDVGIILDARQQTNVTLPRQSSEVQNPDVESLFEYSVKATAALSDLFLRDGHRVGMLIYGRGQQATFPGYGRHQRERILRNLALSRTGENMALENLSYLPVRFFPPRSQIVLVSSLSPADPPILTRLLANGYKLLVVSPDPVAFEAHSLPQDPDIRLARRFARVERRLLLRRLQSYGITIVDWDVALPLEKVLGNVMLRTPVEYRRIGIGL